MIKNILHFPARQEVSLLRVWVATDTPDQPLVCKWIVRPKSSGKPVTTKTHEPEQCEFCA
jgi:hypothetical protein